MADFRLDMTQGENFFEEIASLKDTFGALIQMKRVLQQLQRIFSELTYHQNLNPLLNTKPLCLCPDSRSAFNEWVKRLGSLIPLMYCKSWFCIFDRVKLLIRSLTLLCKIIYIILHKTQRSKEKSILSQQPNFSQILRTTCVAALLIVHYSMNLVFCVVVDFFYKHPQSYKGRITMTHSLLDNAPKVVRYPK